MAKLKILNKEKGSEQTITIIGKINEDSSFDEISIGHKPIITYDFADVEAINSGGVKVWLEYIKKIPADTKINIVNCSSTMIDQINMINGFLPDVSFIKSFYLPYFCEKCGHHTKILINRENKDSKDINYKENVDCEECREPSELDIIEAKFFKFLKKY